MHELSLAREVVATISEQAVRNHATRVTSVQLCIGEVNSAIVESLAFYFEMLTHEDPLLAGAKLLVEVVPHHARCRQCHTVFEVQDGIVCCPRCEMQECDVISGTEFAVKEMEIDQADES